MQGGPSAGIILIELSVPKEMKVGAERYNQDQDRKGYQESKSAAKNK